MQSFKPSIQRGAVTRAPGPSVVAVRNGHQVVSFSGGLGAPVAAAGGRRTLFFLFGSQELGLVASHMATSSMKRTDDLDR